MKTKPQFIAEEVSARVKTIRNPVIVDVGYAQSPNHALRETIPAAKIYGVDLVVLANTPEGYDGVFKIDLNADQLPFDDEGVDAISMGCTLAHVSNPLKVLAELNRVLQKDGVLVVSSPNPNYYWENVLNIFFNHFKNRVSKAKHVEHFFEFSRYNMRTVAMRSGFKVIHEIGTTFQLVKTPLKFNPERFPGWAYEIIYTLQKVGKPEQTATFEDEKGIQYLPTKLY